MFTGLVETTGVVRSLSASDAGAVIEIDPGPWNLTPNPGDSIAIDGCCLTVVTAAEGCWRFDAVPQTLAMTTLGQLQVGNPVHLEAAATLETRLGGHLVQGHVDAVVEVAARETGGSGNTSGEWRLRLRPPAESMEYIVPQGSVTLAGVSLTVASTDDVAGTFDVVLIPTTLDVTHLGAADIGTRLNLETDVIARQVVTWLRRYQSKMS